MKFSRNGDVIGVSVFSLEKYCDNRGYVTESFNKTIFEELLGETVHTFFGHETYSKRDVLRGLHYQIGTSQSRIVRVSYGMIFEVVLDLRKSSPTFGKWFKTILAADKFSAIFVPPGVAHGYFVLSEFALVNAYADCAWNKDNQRCIKWDDEELGIDWPLYREYPILVPPILSDRDRNGQNFLDAEYCN